MLSRLALLEKTDINDNSSARGTLSILFHIVLSGTHASAQRRASIIDKLIDSSIQEKQDLGMNLLEAALQTDHFWTSHVGTFGARPRDFGYHPKTNKEIVDWYRIYLEICTRTALLGVLVSKNARRILANHLRGLWSIGVSLSEFLDDLSIRLFKSTKRNHGMRLDFSSTGLLYDGEEWIKKTCRASSNYRNN
jgi:hypothetical protein